MKELTKAEEEIMQILWTKEKAFVREILEDMPEPKPAYNTVSTIVRILESKKFVSHEAFGKSHRYYPIIDKDQYRKFSMNQLMSGYFGDSASKLVSFFIREKNLDVQDLDEILNLIETKKSKKS